jgi:fermentation-respiration switch protein FrsA (DUF1100 family)
MWSFFKPILIGYAVILLTVLVFQRQLLFYPQPDPGPPTAHGLPQAQVISVTTEDGVTLKSWFVPPVGDAPVIVHFHGNAGSLAGRAYMAEELAKSGYGALIVGYRGYNGNPGHPSEQGLYADARANLNWLQAQFPQLSFVLLGESLGTGITVQLATEFKPAAVILESPYTSIAAVAQYHYWYLPAYWLARDRFDSLSKNKSMQAPLLDVQGLDDTIVPTKFGRALFATANEPKQALWLEGINHSPWMSPRTLPVILEFLAAYTK